MMHFEGKHVKQNYEEAFECYSKAAEQGNATTYSQYVKQDLDNGIHSPLNKAMQKHNTT